MSSIEPIKTIISPITNIEIGDKSKKSFLEFLGESIEKINQLQLEADKMVTAFSIGEDVDIHNVMLAVERASLSLSVITEIRNRALEAYQEIMRMVP